MLVMAALLLAGTTFLTISSTEGQIALNERAGTQAFYLANAGIHRAIAVLNSNPTYSGTLTAALGGGSYQVTADASAGCGSTSARNVVSTGTLLVRGGQTQAQVRVRLDQLSYPFRWAAFATIPNQIVSGHRKVFDRDRTDSELWLDAGSGTDSFDSSVEAYPGASKSGENGGLGGNGDVKLGWNASVKGNVQAGDDILKGVGARITGSQASDVAEGPDDIGEQFPDVIPSPPAHTGDLSVPEDKSYTLSAGTYSFDTLSVGEDGVLKIDSGPVTVYVNTLNFEKESTLAVGEGPVTIYVKGNTTIGDRVTVGGHPGTQLRIVTMSAGDWTSSSARFVAGNNLLLFGSLYGKNTDIWLGEKAQIYGSVVGRTLYAEDGSQFHFDEAMFRQHVCTFARYNIVRGSWHEVVP